MILGSVRDAIIFKLTKKYKRDLPNNYDKGKAPMNDNVSPKDKTNRNNVRDLQKTESNNDNDQTYRKENIMLSIDKLKL